MTQVETSIIAFFHDDQGTTIIVLGPMPPAREKPQDKWKRERLDNDWVAKMLSVAPGPIVELK